MTRIVKKKLKAIAENMPLVYEAGMAEGGGDSWYDTFWDNNQNGGNVGNKGDFGSRTNYQQAYIREGFTDQNYKPKYSMKPTTCSQMFWTNNGITDLEKALETAGVTLDTSECTNFLQFIQSSSITVLPKIDMRKSVVGVSGLTNSNAFSTPSLITIRELVVAENTVFTDPFKASTNLEEITISGTIGQNGFDISKSSKLSKASIESIINALSKTTSKLAVTFSAAAILKAFESSEGANDGVESDYYYSLVKNKPNWDFFYI